MYSIILTFRDVHHVRQHVPDNVEEAQQEEEAEAVDACRQLLSHLIRTFLHIRYLSRLRFHSGGSPQERWVACLMGAPASIRPVRMVHA